MCFVSAQIVLTVLDGVLGADLRLLELQLLQLLFTIHTANLVTHTCTSPLFHLAALLQDPVNLFCKRLSLVVVYSLLPYTLRPRISPRSSHSNQAPGGRDLLQLQARCMGAAAGAVHAERDGTSALSTRFYLCA